MEMDEKQPNDLWWRRQWHRSKIRSETGCWSLLLHARAACGGVVRLAEPHKLCTHLLSYQTTSMLISREKNELLKKKKNERETRDVNISHDTDCFWLFVRELKIQLFNFAIEQIGTSIRSFCGCHLHVAKVELKIGHTLLFTFAHNLLYRRDEIYRRECASTVAAIVAYLDLSHTSTLSVGASGRRRAIAWCLV